MLDKELTSDISNLYISWSKNLDFEIEKLPVSGSERIYFRFHGKQSALAVYNPNKFENETFISFAHSLNQAAVKVPRIYSQNLEKNIYLIEDLGENSLLEFLEKERKNSSDIFPHNIQNLYKKVLKDLVNIQINGDKTIDYEICYPNKLFDYKSMYTDCNLFKYWYLYPIKATFNEQNLEKDFETLCNFLNHNEHNYFMFRDFQARNIMFYNEELYYIDFQGGRKGPLQYDLASLLFQAKAAIPNETREDLLDFYLGELSQQIDFDRDLFREKYYGFVLLRTMQVLGAYGFKGYFQKKQHFIKSIPFAIENLKWFLKNIELPVKLTELTRVLMSIVQYEEKFPKNEIFTKNENIKPLHLHIRSFAYKNGLPEDESNGFGQGFIFDCRNIHNPGRYEPFKKLSGLDHDVQSFLEKDGEINEFLHPVFNLLEQSIEKYLNRGFEYLGINFGCTGGQHRSVYAAEKTKEFLEKKFSGFNVLISVYHRESENWNK